MREKVAIHCVFPMICGSGGSKSRLAKAAGAEPAGQRRDEKCTPLWREAHLEVKMRKHLSVGRLLEVEMSEKCMPLWHEAHFQVKMYKTHQLRTTFGNWDVEKVHAVVARSTFGSQNVQTPRCQTTFGCRKSARRCGAKHIWKSKCAKHLSVGRLLEIEMSKKCTPLWREAHFQVKMHKTPASDHFWKLRMSKKCTPLWREAQFEVKMLKTLGVRTTFGGSDVVSRGRRTRVVDLVKSEQNMRVLQHFDKRWQAWEHLKMICKDAFFVAGAVQKTCSWERLGGQGADFLRGVTFWSIRSVGLLRWFCMFMREVGRSGRWFPERGYILEYQKCRFAKMILHDRCSISYDLAASFRGRRSTLDRWSRKNRRTNWHEGVSAALIFPFLEEVSQKWFVLDVVNLSLTDLFRASSCQVKKLRNVSSNSFIFKLADRQIDR